MRNTLKNNYMQLLIGIKYIRVTIHNKYSRRANAGILKAGISQKLFVDLLFFLHFLLIFCIFCCFFAFFVKFFTKISKILQKCKNMEIENGEIINLLN